MKHQKEVIHFDIPINLSMYDRLPYKLNPTICTKDNISLTSGNLIKGYHVKMDEEKYNINPTDIDLETMKSSNSESNLTNSSNDEDTYNNDIYDENIQLDSASELDTEDTIDAHYTEE